jgi:hypothetical protein
VLGGGVEPLGHTEIGWIAIESDAPDEVPEGPWLQWHNEVLRIPPGATLLGHSPAGPAAFRHGRHLGVQFHPEATPEIVDSWALADPAVESYGITREELAEQSRRHADRRARSSVQAVRRLVGEGPRRGVSAAPPRLVLVLSENWTLTSPRDLRALVDMARAAEDTGIDGGHAERAHRAERGSGRQRDHGQPRDYAAPGNQDPATPWPDSLVLLSAIASVTTRLRLIAAAIIAPLRHPLLLAHQLATLDLLSEGRLVVQPTVSWLRDEYVALGVPFEQRGKLMDEHLAAWKADLERVARELQRRALPLRGRLPRAEALATGRARGCGSAACRWDPGSSGESWSTATASTRSGSRPRTSCARSPTR